MGVVGSPRTAPITAKDEGSVKMTTISLRDAEGRLSELIHRLAPGEEVLLTENDRPVARLVAEPRPRKPRQPGNCKGMLAIVADDDEHLDDFAEYMP